MAWAIILSTLGLGLGLYITRMVHTQGSLHIVIDPLTESHKDPDTQQLLQISVIIPARNEERNVRRCLNALFEQTYPKYEIIVIDDRSTDATPRILAELASEAAHLKVISGEELPAGWAGKPHALVQGAAAAHDNWLCFMDADTFAHPHLLSSAYQLAVDQAVDMLTIVTDQELGTFWERVILPLVFLGLSFGFLAERVNDPSKPDAIANGQFILIDRQVYEQVGGHASVKDRIDEDKAFGTLVKRSGYHLVLADGRKVASTRMYISLSEMWEGWTKNIYLGLHDLLWLLLFGALLGLLVSLVLPCWLVGGLVWLASRGGGVVAAIVSIEATVLWAYLLWKRWEACQTFHIPAGYAFTFPLGAFIFTAMMCASAFYVITGCGVLWKGRRYQQS